MRPLAFIKAHLPWPIRRAIRRARHALAYRMRAPASAREVFTGIYAGNAWGGGRPVADASFPFYSGPGSEATLAEPYAGFINRFVGDHGIRSIVDLGCGDFQVGARIARDGLTYTGIDVVEPLIAANRDRFANARVAFQCLDIIADDLPPADLCLVREVLQHLSNADIQAIIPKLRQYKWLIVTEAQPGLLGSFTPNREKPHGSDTRVLWNSGIDLGAPPFNFGPMELLLSLPAAPTDDPKRAWINTYLVHNASAASAYKADEGLGVAAQ